MDESPLDTFCRQVRARSTEHKEAISLLRTLPGQICSILRQELDSLVRVIFILSQRDRQYRQYLIDAAISGVAWHHNGSNRRITDRDMVEVADKLHGWTLSVYKFGCGFIHLSNMHDYVRRDPLEQLQKADRDAILYHVKYYHGWMIDEPQTMNDLIPILPNVFSKITDNLEYYVRALEQDEDIEEDNDAGD